jgi:hypothetical protein
MEEDKLEELLDEFENEHGSLDDVDYDIISMLKDAMTIAYQRGQEDS